MSVAVNLPTFMSRAGPVKQAPLRMETEISRILHYFMVYMGNLTAPEEQGASDARRMVFGPSALILERLERAWRSRRSPLAWISPWRRRYLDGLIACLEAERSRRDSDGM